MRNAKGLINYLNYRAKGDNNCRFQNPQPFASASQLPAALRLPQKKTRAYVFGVCILQFLSFLTISVPPKPFAAVSQLPVALTTIFTPQNFQYGWMQCRYSENLGRCLPVCPYSHLVWSAGRVHFRVFLYKSTFCSINGHPKQYILVDTIIFNYRFHFGLPGKCFT